MFGDEHHDSWKWVPFIALGVALVFLFFDPFGLNGTKVTYVINSNKSTTPGALAPADQGPAALAASVINNFPAAGSTGPKTRPSKPFTGSVINDSGTTYDGYIFSTCLEVHGSNVTIRNSRFDAACDGSPMVLQVDGTNLRITDSEFIGEKGPGGAVPETAVACSSCSLVGNRVSGTINGFDPKGSAQMFGNYIGQLGGGVVNGSPTHGSGMQVVDAHDMVIQNNTIENDCNRVVSAGGGCNNALFFKPSCLGCSVSGVTIQGNYFKKWNPAYFVIMADKATGIYVNNNMFGDVPALCMIMNGGSIFSWSGNVREGGGAAVQEC